MNPDRQTAGKLTRRVSDLPPTRIGSDLGGPHGDDCGRTPAQVSVDRSSATQRGHAQATILQMVANRTVVAIASSAPDEGRRPVPTPDRRPRLPLTLRGMIWFYRIPLGASTPNSSASRVLPTDASGYEHTRGTSAERFRRSGPRCPRGELDPDRRPRVALDLTSGRRCTAGDRALGIAAGRADAIVATAMRGRLAS